jgi:hypothetical protein
VRNRWCRKAGSKGGAGQNTMAEGMQQAAAERATDEGNHSVEEGRNG